VELYEALFDIVLDPSATADDPTIFFRSQVLTSSHTPRRTTPQHSIPAEAPAKDASLPGSAPHPTHASNTRLHSSSPPYHRRITVDHPTTVSTYHRPPCTPLAQIPATAKNGKPMRKAQMFATYVRLFAADGSGKLAPSIDMYAADDPPAC
jgi:hypothetical protein